MSRKVALTGVEPTGEPQHIGNRLGAIRQGLALAERDDVLGAYLIADARALTGIRHPASSRPWCATWRRPGSAVGLDQDRS